MAHFSHSPFESHTSVIFVLGDTLGDIGIHGFDMPLVGLLFVDTWGVRHDEQPGVVTAGQVSLHAAFYVVEDA